LHHTWLRFSFCWDRSPGNVLQLYFDNYATAAFAGIAPWVSVLGELINLELNNKLPFVKTVHFLWVAADDLVFDNWFPELMQAFENPALKAKFHRHLYSTSKAGRVEREAVSLRLHEPLSSVELQPIRSHLRELPAQCLTGSQAYQTTAARSSQIAPAAAPSTRVPAAQTTAPLHSDVRASPRPAANTGDVPVDTRVELAPEHAVDGSGSTMQDDHVHGPPIPAEHADLTRLNDMLRGRPNSGAVFDDICAKAAQNGVLRPHDTAAADVAVLACGPPAMVADVATQAQKRRFHFHSETFLW